MAGLWDFLRFSIETVNLPYTALLGLVVFYWLTVILGVLDVDLIDFDFDADADLDVDADLDGADGAADGIGFLHSFLQFFHVGVVPLTLLLSLVILNMWATAMTVHYYISDRADWLVAATFIPNVLVSLFLTKLMVRPLLPFFKALDRQDGAAYESLIGKTCVVTTGEANGRFGQAEVSTGGAPIQINVCTGGEIIERGNEAVVIAQEESGGVYRIRRL